MYRGRYPSSDVLSTLATRSTLNPDVADVMTDADRNAPLEQEQIDQCHDKEEYGQQLQQVQLRRSNTIHAQQAGQQDAPIAADDSTAAQHEHAGSSAVVVSRGGEETADTPKAVHAGVGPHGPHLRVVDVQKLDRKSTMHLQLEAVLDRQIAALLDPNDPSVTRADMESWEEDKLDAVVAMVKPQHLPGLIRQSMLINELQPAKLLTWKDLTYVNQRGEPLVKNVTGFLAPGHLVGMFSGPDGGATPLLNVLGQRAVTGKVHGEILYNGRAPDETFNKTVGYVIKEDPHLATLTVYETLYFSARLRLPTFTPDRLVRFRVLMMMKLLGLSHVAHNIVGNAAVRGISGGEKRRVSFGVEMVVGHSVLLADLPTNGLDSATAFGLMRTMRFACRADTSMLCSIVQPSPELFALFHRIIVMSKGATLFYGPPEYAEAYFTALGFIRPPAKTVPQFLEELSASPEKFHQPRLAREVTESAAVRERLPAHTGQLSEWEQQTVGSTHSKSMGVLRPLPPASSNTLRLSAWNKMVDDYEASEFKELLERQIAYQEAKSRDDDMLLEKERALQNPAFVQHIPESGVMNFWYRRYNSSPLQQLQMNLWRLSLLLYRDKGTWRDAWIVNIVLSIFLGSLFYNLGTSQVDVQNRVGLLFYMCAYIGFGGLSLAPVVSYHRPTYYAQLTASYFHSTAYFLSFVLLLMPIAVLEVFFLLLPAYGLANLTGGVFRAEFGFALILLLVVALASRSWVLIVLSLSANEVLANVGLVMSNILFFLLAGFLIRTNEIEASYYWLHVIDYFTYALRSLARNDISPRFNDCQLNTPGCTFNTGDQALEQLYAIDSGSNKWIDFARIVGVWAAFTIAAAFAYALLNWDVPDEPEGANWGHATDGQQTAAVSDGVAEKVPSFAPIQRDGLPPSAMDEGLEMAKTADGSGSPDKEARSMHAVPSVHNIEVPQALHLKKAYIQWKDLCYDVTLPDGSTRRLLNNCFGFAAPGRMCALMGASGAGKSTLLDVLAGIKNQGVIGGELLVNGRPRDASFTSLVGYVEQFDSHNPASTIFEAVRFSGRLRLPRTVTDEDLKEKVWNTLRLLEIDHLAQAIIGAPSTGGVAPEVRKKVTIAVELIMEPAILFLDEPTTGLDSAGAYAVIYTVNKLSEHVAVVCTIHQPPIEIVNFFSDIILMKAGGEVVYVGHMQQLTRYFEEQGLGKIQPNKNPVDFALEQLKQANELAAAAQQRNAGHKPPRSGSKSGAAAAAAAGTATPSRNDASPAVGGATPGSPPLEDDDEKDADKVVTDPERSSRQLLRLDPGAASRLPALFLESEYSREVKETLERGICPPETIKDDAAAAADLKKRQQEKALWTTQVAQLTHRNFLNVWRNKFGLKVRYGTDIAFGFFIGTIFLRLGYDQQWAQERLSVIFITVANTLYGSTAYMPEVYYTRTIYFREHTARMYTASAYFVARYFGDAPFMIAEMLILSLMIYFMTGLNPDDHSRNFGYFFWTLLIVRWAAIAMTHFFATLIAQPGFAATIIVAYMNTMFAACGFFIPEPSIGHQWLWYYDLVPIRYAIDFLVQREFIGESFHCNTDELIYVDNTYDLCPGAIQSPNPAFLLKCPIQCGLDFLQQFGVKSSTIWQVRNMAILHCFMVFFLFLAYLALRFVNHIKR